MKIGNLNLENILRIEVLNTNINPSITKVIIISINIIALITIIIGL